VDVVESLVVEEVDVDVLLFVVVLLDEVDVDVV